MNCTACNGVAIFPDGPKGEIVCSRCGLVVGQAHIAQDFTKWTPEWISHWNKRDSETMREWLTALRTVSCQLNIPNFPYREEAAYAIRKKSDIFFRSQRFGKNKREAIAALIHIILKRHDKIRPLKEICQNLALDHRLVKKYTWEMHKKIRTGRLFPPKDNVRKSAKDYLRNYGLELTTSAKIIQAAEHVLKSISKKVGGSPISLAAGAFYHVCKEKNLKISKDEIGRAFYISPRTVYSNERRIRHLMIKKN